MGEDFFVMRQKEISRQIAFLFVGLWIGILFAYLSDGEIAQMKEYMGLQNLIHVAYYQMDYSEYLIFLVRRRGLLVLVLLFGAMTLMGKYVMSAFVMFLGISMGTTVTFLILHYNMRGLFFFFALLFPQILCYAPAVYEYVSFLCGLHDRVFQNGNMLQIPQKNRVTQKNLLKIIGVTIIGMILECYVNPSIVKFMVKFL